MECEMKEQLDSQRQNSIWDEVSRVYRCCCQAFSVKNQETNDFDMIFVTFGSKCASWWRSGPEETNHTRAFCRQVIVGLSKEKVAIFKLGTVKQEHMTVGWSKTKIKGDRRSGRLFAKVQPKS